MDKKGVIDKIINNLKSKASEVGNSTNKYIKIKKMELEIIKTNKDIDKVFTQMGKCLYNISEDEVISKDIFEDMINVIKMKKEYINSIKKQIELIKEEDEINKKKIEYTKDIPKFIKNPADDNQIGVFKFCKKCNTGNDIKAINCKECGEKL